MCGALTCAEYTPLLAFTLHEEWQCFFYQSPFLVSSLIKFSNLVVVVVVVCVWVLKNAFYLLFFYPSGVLCLRCDGRGRLILWLLPHSHAQLVIFISSGVVIIVILFLGILFTPFLNVRVGVRVQVSSSTSDCNL